MPQATVASSPGGGSAGGVKPVFSSTNEPVPYVLLPMPGFTHAVAEQRRLLIPCDARDRDRVAVQRRGSRAGRDAARSHAREGSARSGTANSSSSSGSQRPVAMSKSIVRDALETSVRCSPRELEYQPGVDRAEHRRAGQRPLAQPVDVVKQPLDLGRREVRVEHEPGARAHEPLVPGGAQLSQRAAVRRSCQTIARCSGSPLAGSHTQTVSRWFEIPTAASSPARTRASASASPATACVTVQISPASCSTQPGRGKCWVISR